jgi:UDP-N-acetyl-D-galactosamine dehydrogenase
MGKYVAEQTVKQMIQRGFPVKSAKVNVLGLTFKENCPDLRNSRVIDVINELRSYGADVYVHDPVANPHEAVHEYGVTLTPWEALPKAHALVVAVAHREYQARPVHELVDKLEPGGLFVDVKCHANPAALREYGVAVWRL